MVTQSDNTNTPVVATIVVVGALAMISISALLTAMVRSAEADVDAVRPMHADLQTIATLDQQQLAALNAPVHWVDKPAGKIGIPIDRAMQLVLADLRRNPSAASPPVPPGLILPPSPPATPPAEGAAASPAAGNAPGTATGAGAAPAGSATSAAAGSHDGVTSAGGSPSVVPPTTVSPKAVSPNAAPPKGVPPNAPPPSGAAPGAAPAPAAPATPPVPASRKL